MKNIQIIDGADNCTFSIFQATDREFRRSFPAVDRISSSPNSSSNASVPRGSAVLTPIWERPIAKKDVKGLHGTLFYGFQSRKPLLPEIETGKGLESVSAEPGAAKVISYAPTTTKMIADYQSN